MKNDDLVRVHFQDIAKEFDAIYDDDINLIKRTINKIFRGAVRKRLALTVQECGKNKKEVLDIGCGSGRLSLSLAENGLNVTGIDYSSEMINLANRYLKTCKENLNNELNIEFICCDFLKDFKSKKPYDITIALGVFDYIKDPLPFMKKITELTKEKTIISFPAKYSLHTPVRKIWLYTKKCPAYFYTEEKIAFIYNSVGISNYQIIKTPSSYLVKGYKSSSYIS